MTSEDPLNQLDEIRRSGDLEKLRQLVDSTERRLSREDSVPFLLRACDILSSHDFGDYEKQTILAHRYARLALDRNLLAALEKELRILAHLEHDYGKAAEAEQDWEKRRLSHSRKWLRALRLIEEMNERFPIEEVPHLKALPPEAHLPSGVSPEHLAESPVRNKYLSSIEFNRQKAERFALRWRLKQLRKLYEPMAARYILSAYGREPFKLDELRRLFGEFPGQTKWDARSDSKTAESGSAGLRNSRDYVTSKDLLSVSTVGSIKTTAAKGSSRPDKARAGTHRKNRDK
jgi:hypothetical protein